MHKLYVYNVNIGYMKTKSFIIWIAGLLITGFVGCIVLIVFMASIHFSGMLVAITLPKLFGTREVPSLMGFGQAGGSVGAMLGAPIAGGVFTATGSYRIFLIAGSALIIATILLTVVGTSKKAYALIAEKEREISS